MLALRSVALCVAIRVESIRRDLGTRGTLRDGRGCPLRLRCAENALGQGRRGTQQWLGALSWAGMTEPEDSLAAGSSVTLDSSFCSQHCLLQPPPSSGSSVPLQLWHGAGAASFWPVSLVRVLAVRRLCRGLGVRSVRLGPRGSGCCAASASAQGDYALLEGGDPRHVPFISFAAPSASRTRGSRLREQSGGWIEEVCLLVPWAQ